MELYVNRVIRDRRSVPIGGEPDSPGGRWPVRMTAPGQVTKRWEAARGG